MSSIRPWALWRRIQYLAGLFLVVGMSSVLIYFTNFYEQSNCFDGIMNGSESGIDCGGGCVRICSPGLLSPRTVWAESFLVTGRQYNAVAYVENPNQTAGTPALGYTFELFSRGVKVGERLGTTTLPANSTYPIFAGRVFVDTDEPVTETRITLKQPDLWLPSFIERDQFRSVDIELVSADSRPQLKVKIENTSLVTAEKVEVIATIFNEDGTPVTASQTFVDSIRPRSTENIVFTWPNPIAKTIKNCVIPTDIAVVIDLSGSMNNDGDNPPQPITKALKAASLFINNLRERDQVSVITFATEAILVTPLTSQHELVAESTLALTIDPASETGFTNTVDALRISETELSSVRHNPNARRALVLLTDGLPTKSGDDDVVREAEEVARQIDSNGVEIYSIGLGKDVSGQFIRNIASNVNNAYLAPTGEELNSIYNEITSSLCEVGPTKIEVIAKPEMSFAPLR